MSTTALSLGSGEGPGALSGAGTQQPADLATLSDTANDKDVAGVVKQPFRFSSPTLNAVRQHSLSLAAEDGPSEPA